MKNAQQFYDDVSVFYDEMINFESSIINRKTVISNLIKPGMSSAVDLGCGSGLDSISLAYAGLNVNAFDISAGMIETARKNSIQRGFDIKFELCPLDKIPTHFHGKFDFALSLGNTLANLDPKILKKSLNKAYKILKPKGVLVIQLLNYGLIKKLNKRIVKISTVKDDSIIRFYDIFKKKFIFNILKYNISNPSVFDLSSSVIYPYDKEAMKNNLSKSGFRKIKFYGSLNFDKFDHNKSENLVVIANRE